MLEFLFVGQVAFQKKLLLANRDDPNWATARLEFITMSALLRNTDGVYGDLIGPLSCDDKIESLKAWVSRQPGINETGL